MLLRYFYDKSLAHASYLVGCQRSGEAIMIDPGRSIDHYLEAAASEGMRIVGAAETHIHADFVSGSRELANRVAAKLYLSDEGPDDWKYQFADSSSVHLLKDGDSFYAGKIKLQTLHTPGHTPESISFVLTDEGSGAHIPMGIFTGDFVFVGSIGRPDLLETAAGIAGSAESGARQLFHSVKRFLSLPDHLQVWPAHGAGSACGKGLGAIPSTTVGYERLFNPALQYKEEQHFVNYILTDQPETPFYFAEMKRVNKVGPNLLKDLSVVNEVPAKELPRISNLSLVIDTTRSGEFAEAHVPGTINIPSGSLVQWAGFFVDYRAPVYLITKSSSLQEDLKQLRSIGIDNVVGYFDATLVSESGLRVESYQSLLPIDLQAKIAEQKALLIDVRAKTEFQQGHIQEAQHHFLGTILRNIEGLDRSRPIVAQCLSGGRSAIAASILQRAGYDVINMQGGFKAWVAAGLPIVSEY